MNCPGCGSELLPHRVHELDAFRCPECPGLWLDLQVLERAAGEPLALTPLGDTSALPCARCGRKLSSALFPGGIPVEACLSCKGLFLRAGDDPKVVETFAGYPERLLASKRKATAADGVSIVRDMLKSWFGLFR